MRSDPNSAGFPDGLSIDEPFFDAFCNRSHACIQAAPAVSWFATWGRDMKPWIVAAGAIAAIAVTEVACAQSAGMSQRVVLLDATGKVAARPLNETLMLVTVAGGIAAPASIRPIYGPDGRPASAWATWQSGGSVLFTSPDCTVGAHVYGSQYAGVRAAAQVQTPGGIVLYVGADGSATTVAIQSVLYETGCAPLTIRQSGLFPVVTSVNLSTAYPPPLSLQ
jgi:hypothetical protein